MSKFWQLSSEDRNRRSRMADSDGIGQGAGHMC